MAAVGFGVLTVLVGTLILADVSGPKAAAPPGRLLGGHVFLALGAVVALGVGAVVADLTVSCVALVGLVGASLFGLAAWRRTAQRARTDRLKAPSNAVLVMHGLAATATVILASAAVGHLL